MSIASFALSFVPGGSIINAALEGERTIWGLVKKLTPMEIIVIALGSVAAWCWWGWHDDHARIAKVETRDRAAIANRDDWLRYAATELNQAADFINKQSAAVQHQAVLGKQAQQAAETTLGLTTRARATIDGQADAVRSLAPPTGPQTHVEKPVRDLGDL